MLLSMTFQEWADSIFAPITYFVNWLKMVASSLMDNYIFVTFLCIVLSISLIWFIFYLIQDFLFSKLDSIDDYNDKMKNYELYKDIQRDYFYKNGELEYLDAYKRYSLHREVVNDYFDNNTDLIRDFKMKNLQLNRHIFADYVSDNFDSEVLMRLDNLRVNKETSYIFSKDFVDEDVQNRYESLKNQQIAKTMVVDDLDGKGQIRSLSDDIAYTLSSYANNPSWLDNPPTTNKPLTEEEKKEIENILNNF